jgi:hypothetical protein
MFLTAVYGSQDKTETVSVTDFFSLLFWFLLSDLESVFVFSIHLH